MPEWAKIFAGLSIATLAACTSNPARNGSTANWQDPKFALPESQGGIPKGSPPSTAGTRGVSVPTQASTSSSYWTNDDRVVVIDPGHGGEDPGTRSVLDGRAEKEFTLDWALQLAGAMSTGGWQVVLTRTNDVSLGLAERVAIADRHKAAMFISLHFNSAAPNETQFGLETYYVTPSGLPSSIDRGYGDDPSAAFPNNAYDSQNLLIAMRAHRALLGIEGLKDRGVRRARFMKVLRDQHRPAILIEGGYLSNPVEARLISDASYRQRLAMALAEAFPIPQSPPNRSVVSSVPDGVPLAQTSVVEAKALPIPIDLSERNHRKDPRFSDVEPGSR